MSFRSELKKRLPLVKNGAIIYLNNTSETAQARAVAKELGIQIRITSTADNKYMVRYKPDESIAVVMSAVVSQTRYIDALKHWEIRRCPIGASGSPRTQLSWYEEGHKEIPTDYMIYVEEYNMIFKPRYVLDPSDLLNDRLIEHGLKPTRIMLDQYYNELVPNEAEHRFDVIRKYVQERKQNETANS